MESDKVRIKDLRSMRKIFQYSFLIFIIILLLILIAFFYYLYSIYTPNSQSNEVKEFIVSRGESSETIALNLKKTGLIKNQIMFMLYSNLKGVDNKIQIGSYKIPSDTNMKDLLRVFTLAKSKLEKEFIIIEGMSNKEIADYFEKNKIMTTDEFQKVVSKKADWWDNYEFLKSKPSNLDLEGYLFPDTYRIFYDAKPEDIIKKILNNFDRKLNNDLRKEIEKQGKTFHEIISLASILEKEVSTDEDRRLASGIFHKRLNIGMPLQSDATVNYVTGKKTLRPTEDDIQTESLYNTYKYKGLPSGPINNPGLSSIKAALYPQENIYFYFLTTPEGEVIYSKTYEEHLIAKRKYLK